MSDGKPSLLRRIVAAFRAPAAAPQAPRRNTRMYAAARGNRMTGGYGMGGDSSADAELASSLTRLRAASRQMVRDSAYAKRARVVVVNNVIGSGVGMQAQVETNRAGANGRVNADIESAFRDWCCADSCHAGGALHFHDLERAAMAQVFEAGEVFIRKHRRAFGSGKVPLALELVEAERVPLDIALPSADGKGVETRMGIEQDEYGRAVAYWIRKKHPGDLRSTGGAADLYERVEADYILHLRIIDRWPQTRGEPWLHTSARKLNDMDQYSGAEVQAARASAMVFGTIKTPESDPSITSDEEDDGSQVMDIEPGTIQQLNPGEELDFHSPNRPNTALDPFMRYMLREVAAGTGVSYESLSRDYSQSNYSSSRLALLDDRDLWKVLQQWWIRAFRAPLHKEWLRQAVYARAVPSVSVEQYALNPAKFEAVAWKPRGWSWVDPTKEVKAYKEAIRAGLTSATDVIAATADGRDIEDVIAALKREAELFKQAGITVDTDVAAEQAAAQPKAPPAAGDGEDDEGAAAQPARRGPPPLRPVPTKGLMQ
jgi:lambda family phage portal protein